MAVVVETTLGDITIDLYINERPKACLNFLKLCKIKYFNFNLFHTVNQGFIAQTGDPTGSRIGGESIWGVMEGPLKRYFEAENTPRIKHTSTGLVSFVGDKDSMIGSQFFITLAPDLTYLDAQHCVFGEVTEGFDVLRLLNEAICDSDHRPYQDIRITHTVILEDPFPDPENLRVPDASPEPTAERLQGGRIAPDEEIDETEGKTVQEVQEIIAQKEAKARATILEMIGDIPDADMAPPENVLFVCKLNPVTNDDDLEIIFSRFGKIKSCEVIRDKKSGDSLQYAFVEFEEQKSCEDAYFKMDNVLIDDRRIHVDFSQSVAKIKWHGKGRGVTHYNERGEKEKDDPKNDIGNGRYRKRENRESPTRKLNNKREDRPESGDRYENGNFRNRNFNFRQNQRDRRDERFRPDNRNKIQNHNQENRRQRSSSRENERSRRNRSRSVENNRAKQELTDYTKRDDLSRSRNNQRSRQIENDYKKKERSRSREYKRSRQRNMSPDQKDYRRKQERSRSRSRNNQRTNQVEREYKRREERSRSRENDKTKRNFSPADRNYKGKQMRNISRSQEYNKSRHRNTALEEKENRKKLEKNKNFEKESSEEEVKKKKKSKKTKKDSSCDDSSSQDDTPVKKSKKSKKKKSKRKKQQESNSNSESDFEEERKKDKKKKKKKSKKYDSSSDSESDSDSDVPKKKRKH